MSTTWNPSDLNANVTLSNGNLTMTSAGATYSSVRSTNSPAKTSGKWHVEFKLSVLLADVPIVGIADSSASLANGSYIGFDIHGIGIDPVPDLAQYQVFQNAVDINAYSGTAVQGDIIAIEVDIDNKLVWFMDVTQATGWTNASNTTFTGNPGAGTGGTTFTLTTTGGVMLGASSKLNDGTIILNPSPPFAQTPSSGFLPWDGPAVGYEGYNRRQGVGASFIFLPRTMRPDQNDQQVHPSWNAVLIPKLNTWEPFPQFARKHTAPTRAWARLDEQFMPTWNAVLIPTLQSWELPIQFAKRLFRQAEPQQDVPSFVAAPVAQPYGFDFAAQGASRIIWQPKTQPGTPSFIPQLSILDSIIQFTSRLLLRRPQTENPIVIPVVAAPRADLELFPRRLITMDHAIPIDLVSPIVPVVPIDREQFPARLEFTPRIQQFESFVIVIATQLLQLTLVAWKWIAQAPSLAFTLTGSLVAWIWKANAALLAQTMILALKAWIWKPFAALLAGTITATHVVWKWLPQAPSLALSLGFSTPGIVWRWLAQAPSLFFPIILQTTTAVWLWVGRALAGGTHFAKVTYGLLLQVGRLRNR